MKKKNLITILLAVVMLVTCTTAFVLAENHHITREDFFNSIAKALELTPSDMELEFDDAEEIAPEYKENIAAGVKEGYFFGRGNGLLDPKTEITLEEVDWVLSRINFKPETKYVHSTNTVTKTKYVEVPVEKIVEKEVIVAKPGCIIGEAGETHYYALDSDGVYKCACEGDNKKTNPVGTRKLFSYAAIKTETPVDDSCLELMDVDVEDLVLDEEYVWQIQKGNGWMVDSRDGLTYPIACDAKCFDSEGNQISYAEFMETYDLGCAAQKWYKVKLLTATYDWVDKYDSNYSGDKIVYAIQIVEEIELK